MPPFSAKSVRAWGLAALLLTACNRSPQTPQQTAPAPQPAPAPAASTDPNDSGRPKVVVLGDSLTAGYGLLEMQAFPALLQEKLNVDGYQWEVVNAGLSGDTSAAGLQRVDWALSQGDVRILILELGANDGLRGLPVAEMKKNLAAIIERSQKAGAQVLLIGVRMPPNYGEDYAKAFAAAFAELAAKHKLALLPDLLDGFGEKLELFQADRIHPTETAQPAVLKNVWTKLAPLLGRK